MFGITLGSLPPPRTDSKPRIAPSPTPVRFPCVEPNTGASRQTRPTPSVQHLQTIHRPADLNLSHFEALNIHVISDVSPSEIIPQGFLPPVDEWNAISEYDLLEINEGTRQPLSNGNLSPGVQIYRGRKKELLTDNTAAFRTVRRIPPPPGEQAARLGNTYEFFKNLELFSSYWPDTSLQATQPSPENKSKADDESLAIPIVDDKQKQDGNSKKPPSPPIHFQTHVPLGNGAQLPPDYRTHLLHSFTKLVAYDFGCNVGFARTEPRLHLTPSTSLEVSRNDVTKQNPKLRQGSKRSSPPSYFNSSATFIYRNPTDRAAARSGQLFGPLAALSPRTSHTFSSVSDEHLDFAREIVAILLTAQQRSRQHKIEKRFGEGEWWTSVPRWGGGPGGPIGREADARGEKERETGGNSETGKGAPSLVTEHAKRAIGGISSAMPAPSSSFAGGGPNKRSKRHGSGLSNGNMQIYENYRKLVPPNSSWDRKCQYEAIGKVPGAEYDDIFLLSCINHHVSIVKARVPDKLVEVLEGAEEGDEGFGELTLWRSKWFDLYIGEERVEAMGLIWGLLAWLMRKVDDQGDAREKMDLS